MLQRYRVRLVVPVEVSFLAPPSYKLDEEGALDGQFAYRDPSLPNEDAQLRAYAERQVDHYLEALDALVGIPDEYEGNLSVEDLEARLGAPVATYTPVDE